jgi:hypothetical protein
MAKGNPNIAEIAGRGRKKRSEEQFYFKIDDSLRVTRDSYNIVLAEVFTAEESGRKYQVTKGFYSTVDGVCIALEGSYKLPADIIDSFRKRAGSITSKYINGRLKLEAPEDILYDEHDVLTDTNTTANNEGGAESDS